MAAHLTLEEAAEHLGIAPEEFKKRLKTDPQFKALVPIRDGSNLRFKSAQIEELARELGAASNPELPLAPLEGVPPDSDDFKVGADAKKEEEGKDGSEDSLNLSSPLEDDIFSLAPEAAAEPGKKQKPGSDSDVRLEAGKKTKKKPDDSDESVVPTEELSIDFSGPGSAVIKGGSSAKLSAPKSSAKIPKPDSGKLSSPGAADSSEFELSLDADSDDFELKLNTDASDEVDLGELPKDTTGSGRRGGESGINLRDPKDSGISLEKGKGKEKAKEAEEKSKKEAASESAASDVDFELTLDSSAAASSLKLGGLKGKQPLEADSDSEFELTLDDSSDSGLDVAGNEDAEKRDIFETDFEIPPMDESASEAVSLEPDTDVEKSDSDVEATIDSDVVSEDASGSEVVLVEEEEAEAAPKAKKKTGARKAVDVTEEEDVDLAGDVDLAEEDASASRALKGLKGRRAGEDEDEEEGVAVSAAAYRPVPWGPIPALFLLPALVLTLVGGLVGFELLQTMWGYQQPRKPAAPLVRAIASNLDIGELKDQ